MSDAIVWNGMSQGELDAAYDNMAAVRNSAERLAAWSADSARLRDRQRAELDIPYGPRPRNRFDVFRSGATGAPLLVFIHGGWWQRNSKEVFACVAEGPMAHDIDVALLGYTLAPDASLAQIVGEIRAGLDAVVAHQSLQGRATSVLLSGWSAGGHLTALTMDHPAVVAGLSISGVFDLEPIRLSYINDKLRLRADEVAALSPLHRPPTNKPLTLAYGLAELPELRRQSTDFGARLSSDASPLSCMPLADHDHFSIIEELRDSSGRLVTKLLEIWATVSPVSETEA